MKKPVSVPSEYVGNTDFPITVNGGNLPFESKRSVARSLFSSAEIVASEAPAHPDAVSVLSVRSFGSKEGDCARALKQLVKINDPKITFAAARRNKICVLNLA